MLCFNRHKCVRRNAEDDLRRKQGHLCGAATRCHESTPAHTAAHAHPTCAVSCWCCVVLVCCVCVVLCWCCVGVVLCWYCAVLVLCCVGTPHLCCVVLVLCCVGTVLCWYTPPVLCCVGARQRGGLQAIALVGRGGAAIRADGACIGNVGQGQELQGVQVVQVFLAGQVKLCAVEVHRLPAGEAVGVGAVHQALAVSCVCVCVCVCTFVIRELKAFISCSSMPAAFWDSRHVLLLPSLLSPVCRYLGLARTIYIWCT